MPPHFLFLQNLVVTDVVAFVDIIFVVDFLILLLQITSWDDYFYDLAARNSIDVGEFVGRCLAGVIQQ